MGATIELKPCPFCGGDANVRINTDRFYGRNDAGYPYEVGCDKMDCRGFYFVARFYETEDAAIEAWNRRI